MRILMYNRLWRCIEAVITSLTRNQVVTFSWHESSNLFASVKFKKLPFKGAFLFYPYTESLFYSPDVHRSYILPSRISIPKASSKYI